MHKMGVDVTVNEPVNRLWINVDTQFVLVGVEQGTGDQRVDNHCLHLQPFESKIFIITKKKYENCCEVCCFSRKPKCNVH